MNLQMIHQRKKHIIWILLYAVIISLTGCADNNKDASSHIKKARNYVSKGEPENAAIEYLNAIKLDPENHSTYFELAETYVLLKKVRSAVRNYKQAIVHNPENKIARLRLCQIYLKQDKLFQARKLVMEVLDMAPKSIPAYHLLSGIKVREDDLAAAIKTLEKARHIDETVIKTNLYLANLYVKNHEYKKAEELYRDIFNKDSENREAYMGLVGLYAFQKRWEKIEVLLHEVLATPGIKSRKHLDLARFYERMRQYRKSEQHYTKAVELAEDKVPFLLSLTEYYVRRGDETLALEALEQALSIKQGDPAIRTGMAGVYLAFNRIDKAEQTIDDVLDKHSGFPGALVKKGRILMHRQEYKSAMEKFETVINMERLNAEAFYYQALCLQNKASGNDAEEKVYRAAAGMLDDPKAFTIQQVKKYLQSAVTINPDFLDARIRLAETYLLEKEAEKAEKQIREVYRLAPKREKTVMLIAGLKILKGETGQAVRILEKLASDNPDHFRVHARLGLLYYNTGRYDKAAEVLKKAYDMEPSALGLLEIIADSYIKKGQYETAYAVIEESMNHAGGGTSAATLENLKGEIMIQNGREEKALAHFDKARRLDSDFIKPVLYAAEILRHQKQFNRAAELYRQAVEIDPDNATALMGLGYSHDVLGNASQAEKFYNRVLDVDPFHVMASNNLAFLLADRNAELDRALKLASFARGKRSEDPDILDTLGWVYYKKGSFRSALSELEESLAIKPDNALACYHMGMALYQSGKYEEARTFLKKALNLDPSFKGAESARTILN